MTHILFHFFYLLLYLRVMIISFEVVIGVYGFETLLFLLGTAKTEVIVWEKVLWNVRWCVEQVISFFNVVSIILIKVAVNAFLFHSTTITVFSMVHLHQLLYISLLQVVLTHSFIHLAKTTLSWPFLLSFVSVNMFMWSDDAAIALEETTGKQEVDPLN